MKKTRILAALLCVMMVVCALPMIQASATATYPSSLMNAIGAVIGAGGGAEPAEASADWPTTNLIFDENFDETQDGVSAASGITYDSDGINFPAGSAAPLWKYRPTCNYNGWTPLCISGNFTFGFKLDEGGTLQVQAAKVWSGDGRVYVDFSTTGLTVYNGGETDGASIVVTELANNYVPGTDWNDVLVMHDATNGGYHVYMKKATDAAFTLVADAPTYRDGNAWNTGGLSFYAQGAHVNYAVSCVATGYPTYDSVEDILGPVATTYNLELNDKFADTMTPDNTMGITHSGTYSANGWSGTSWRLLGANGVAWSPLKSGGYESAVGFTATVTANGMNVQGHSPLNNGRIYFDIKAGQTPWSNAPTKTFTSTLTADTNPADYLITQANGGSGYALYMKSATVTDGKWALITETSDYQSSNSSNRGFVFADDGDCVISNVRLYSKNVVTEGASKPAGATELMYADDFDTTPAYSNPGGTGASYDDGNLILTENADQNAEIWWFNMEIPVGGYAEYRMANGAGDTYTSFRDGATQMVIYQRAGYGTVTNAPALLYAFDGGADTYRTWRVVRNSATTYSVYCKADDDTAWYNAATNVAGATRNDSKHINFVGSKNYAGEEGVAKFDYFKVYGPAITDTLTITDGHGTVVPAEGGKLTFPQALRAIVKADTGKLLVATYADNDMLKAQIVDVASMADDEVFVNAKVSGGNKVKVFYWDNFTNLNSLKTVATFSY